MHHVVNIGMLIDAKWRINRKAVLGFFFLNLTRAIFGLICGGKSSWICSRVKSVSHTETEFLSV